MMLEKGVEAEKKLRKYRNPVGTSWRIDENYIKIQGQWKYLLLGCKSEKS